MMKRLYVSVLTAAAVMAVAPLAQAEKPEELSAESFGALDTDKDGKLVRSELESFPAMAEHFEAVDADADGALDLDEFRNLLAASRKQEKQPS